MIHFFIIDKVVEYYNKLKIRIVKSIGKEVDSELIRNNSLKFKIIKSENSADFHAKDEPEVDFKQICLPITLLESILEKDGKSYPEVFLEECNYKKDDKICRR